MTADLSLEDVLSQNDKHYGWLYLPAQPWTLATIEAFIDMDDLLPGEKPALPARGIQENWTPVLDAESIEDVIAFAKRARSESSLENLLAAFILYV